MNESDAPTGSFSDERGVTFDAVVLAGGRGSRLGGVDKAALQLGGERMIDRVLAAAKAAGAERLIAVGPPHVGQNADCVVREDPPFSGPLSALAAALTEVRAPWVLLLACDLVRPTELAARLAAALGGLPAEVDGAIMVDGEGQLQWLAGCYRSESLRVALERVDGAEGRSLRSAVGKLILRELPAEPGSSTRDIDTRDIDTRDIDTPEQLAEARNQLREERS